MTQSWEFVVPENKKDDDLVDTLAAPLRDKPAKPPAFDAFVSVRKRHTELREQLDRANEKRELAIAKLRRADDKVRDLRKALARSTKRIDEARAALSQPNDVPDDPLED